MKIIWSDFASEMLKDIFQYHKKVAGRKIAQRLKDKIFLSTKQLIFSLEVRYEIGNGMSPYLDLSSKVKRIYALLAYRF